MKGIFNSKRCVLFSCLVVLPMLFFLVASAMAIEMTPEQKIARIQELAAEALAKAAQALETGNLALAQEAQGLSEEAAALLSEVATFAADTGNTALAQAAMDASVNVLISANLIVSAAENIAATSTDPATVTLAETLKTSATTNQGTIASIQEIATLAGAVPPSAEAYEPAGPGFDTPLDEPPIEDGEPASPV